MVVSAAVAVMVSMLLPALQKAKQRAQQGVCADHLRQIYNGFALYASDFDDKIPPVGTPYPYYFGTRGLSWHHFLGKGGYLGAIDKFTGTLQGFTLDNTRWAPLRCPGEPGSAFIQGKTYFDDEMVATSYIMNWSVSRYWYYPPSENYGAYCIPAGCICNDPSCIPYPFRKGFSVGPQNGRPAEAALVMDCSALGYGWAQPYFEWNIDNDSYWQNYTFYAFRHPGNRANVLYMDGHVDGVRPHKDTGKSIFTFLWDNDPP